jgi:hypothetical protein
MTTTQEEEQEQVTQIIPVTECLTEPCPIYYTDSLSQSILVICKNKKHAHSDPADIDVEKQENGVNGSQPNSDTNLLGNMLCHNSPTLSGQRSSKL